MTHNSFVKKYKLENKGNFKGPVFVFGDKKFSIKEMSIFYRKKGMRPEGHFHKGLDKSHDPQSLILISGKLKLHLKTTGDETQTEILEQGDVIEIPKFVFHKYETLEDSIFLEPRSEIYKEHPDKFDLQEFNELVDSTN